MSVEATTPTNTGTETTTTTAGQTVTGTEVQGAAPPAPETKPEPKVADRFAQLAKRERALVKRDQEAKAQLEVDRTALAKERAEYEAWKKAKAEEDTLWQSDPLEGLKRRGLDYDKLTQHVLSQGKPTPDKIAERIVNERLKEHERKQAEKAEADAKAEEAKATAASQEAHARALQEFQKEVTDFVHNNNEKYELITLYGKPAEDTILATIEQHYQDTLKAGQPKIMSKEEAADLVEKYLEDEAQKITQAKKLAKASPQPEGDKTQSKPAPQRTLTNNLTPSSAPAAPTLSREERIKRALALEI